MTRLANIALAVGLFTSLAPAQSPAMKEGTVRGEVFTVDPSAAHAIVPGAKVALDGPVHIEAESDSEGKFSFNAVPSGSYTITSQAPGMTTQQSLVVDAGSVSDIALEMKVQSVTESTTVTSSDDSVDSKQSSGINAISESAIKNMPNLDER